MKPITVITRVVVKPGQLDAFIKCQKNFIKSLLEGDFGLLDSSVYPGVDGDLAVQISRFSSMEARQRVGESEVFQTHLSELIELTESFLSDVYEAPQILGRSDHASALPAGSV